MSYDEIKSFVEIHPQEFFSIVPFLPGITNACQSAIVTVIVKLK